MVTNTALQILDVHWISGLSYLLTLILPQQPPVMSPWLRDPATQLNLSPCQSLLSATLSTSRTVSGLAWCDENCICEVCYLARRKMVFIPFLVIRFE